MTISELIKLLEDTRDNPRNKPGGTAEIVHSVWDANIGQTFTHDFSHVLYAANGELILCTSEVSREGFPGRADKRPA